MSKKYYLGEFFWVPIPVKRYQNMSGFASGNTYMETDTDMSIHAIFQPLATINKNIFTNMHDDVLIKERYPN